QLDRAGDIHGAGRGIVDRPALCGRGPFRRVGRPAEHGRDAGALRLERERAADRAEAEDAEAGGAHRMEASRSRLGRKREGRLGSGAALRPSAWAKMPQSQPPSWDSVIGTVIVCNVVSP